MSPVAGYSPDSSRTFADHFVGLECFMYVFKVLGNLCQTRFHLVQKFQELIFVVLTPLGL
jgi:hypothetical protein